MYALTRHCFSMVRPNFHYLFLCHLAELFSHSMPPVDKGRGRNVDRGE